MKAALDLFAFFSTTTKMPYRNWFMLQGFDLSTYEVAHLTQGTLIKANQRAVNQEGVLRIRLADGSGWTSVTSKLNDTILAEALSGAHHPPLDKQEHTSFGQRR